MASKSNIELDLIESFANLLIAISKRIKDLIIITTIFIFCGFVYWKFKIQVYKMEMIVSSSVINSERLTFLIEPLGKLAIEGNYKELSKQLNIDSSTAKYIKNISAKDPKEESSGNSDNYDSEALRQQNCFVSIEIKDNPKYGDTIQTGILKYLRNNNFVSRRIKVDQDNLLFLKSRIQKEIKALDSLKTKVAGSNMMDPSSINNSVANLYQQELNINAKLSLQDGGINIIREFIKFNQPIGLSFKLLMLFSFCSGLIFSILFILITDLIIQYKKQNSSI